MARVWLGASSVLVLLLELLPADEITSILGSGQWNTLEQTTQICSSLNYLAFPGLLVIKTYLILAHWQVGQDVGGVGLLLPVCANQAAHVLALRVFAAEPLFEVVLISIPTRGG